MELSENQKQRLIQALGHDYLDQLFRCNQGMDHGPCYEGSYLLAKALQNTIGGDLYTVSGHYLVTGGPIDWHIFLKKDDQYWDHWGRHTQGELAEIWRQDNLENLQIRPFKAGDLITVGLDSPWSGYSDDSGRRFFEVLHGEEFDSLVRGVSRYFELTLNDEQEKVDLCIWACGVVCKLDEIEEYSWLSDDYLVTEMPLGLDEDIFAAATLSGLRRSMNSVSPQQPETTPDF